jgi:hypothetical protein
MGPKLLPKLAHKPRSFRNHVTDELQFLCTELLRIIASNVEDSPGKRYAIPLRNSVHFTRNWR